MLELKYKRFNVEARKKGVQLSVDGRMMYWHEFFAEYFDVTARHFQQLEKQLREGDKPEDDKTTSPSRLAPFAYHKSTSLWCAWTLTAARNTYMQAAAS